MLPGLRPYLVGMFQTNGREEKRVKEVLITLLGVLTVIHLFEAMLDGAARVASKARNVLRILGL